MKLILSFPSPPPRLPHANILYHKSSNLNSNAHSYIYPRVVKGEWREIERKLGTSWKLFLQRWCSSTCKKNCFPRFRAKERFLISNTHTTRWVSIQEIRLPPASQIRWESSEKKLRQNVKKEKEPKPNRVHCQLFCETLFAREAATFQNDAPPTTKKSLEKA